MHIHTYYMHMHAYILQGAVLETELRALHMLDNYSIKTHTSSFYVFKKIYSSSNFLFCFINVLGDRSKFDTNIQLILEHR